MKMNTRKQYTELAKGDIIAIIAEGTIPEDVKSFSELHDYIDANELLKNIYIDAGCFNEKDEILAGIQSTEGETATNMANLVIGDINEWLKSGRPVHHTNDSDCTLDESDTCIVCGVYHGDTCPMCGGRGYHNAGCIGRPLEENEFIVSITAVINTTDPEIIKAIDDADPLRLAGMLSQPHPCVLSVHSTIKR
jgi:hypothetical protein